MAFNGSAHFKPGELVSYFESVGARLGPHVNAYTSFDETVYMLDLPTDKPGIVNKGLTALADFAGGLTLSPEEIDKERGVVIEEWRGGLGAGSRIRDKQFPILFYKSRYAERLPIGKPDVIRNAPVERLRAFYDTWYRPDRMAVIAAGDIDASQIEQSSKETFAGVEDGRLEEGIAALATEAKRIREFGFSATEMDRAKKWMAASYERAYSERDKTESSSFASEYVRYFLDDEPSPGIEYEYKLVQQLLPGISVNEASAMAKALLADDSRVILAVSPQKPAIRIPSDAELQAALTATNAAPVTEWVDASSGRALMEHAPAAAAVVSRRAIDGLGVTVVKFANGVDAWLKPTDFKNDQVLFTLDAPGGTSLAPAADYPEATLATG